MTGGGVASPFPPIGEYAFLSDCHVNALIAPSGNVEWLCLPRPDGPSVFAAILDRDAGGFRVGAFTRHVPAGRRYVPGTMVLETTWQTPTGWLVVREALTIGPWRHAEARAEGYRRAPTDHEAEGMLVRVLECVEGAVDVGLLCMPRFGYGRNVPRWSYSGPGYGDAVATGESGDPELRLTTTLRLGLEGPRAHARTTLHAGGRAYAALSWSDCPPPADVEEAEGRIDATIGFWRDWLSRGRFPDHPWRAPLQRSVLTLKGLTYAPTGALLAAATTSLPETPGGERNWDYRYTWIRDSTFMLLGLHALGFVREAEDYFLFVAESLASGPELQIMYGIGGEHTVPEQTLDHLSGYEGARPVRIGNAAFGQRQHDVWGAALDSALLHIGYLDHVPDRLWVAAERLAGAALRHWRDPDRGIWEVRGEPRHFTSSKVMCWVAADRAARLARRLGDDAAVERWATAAAEIHADVCERGIDERGVFVQHYETTALDASTLLIPLVGFLPGDDPRIRATVLAIADELTEDGLVLRYRVGQTDDGLTGEEGTFLICSFWLVSALAEIGERRRARQLLERLLSFAGPLGLYAEEVDARSGRHLGNFPQAFSHLALINAVMRLIEPAAPGREP